jgi:hypothetical protein
MDYVQVNMFNFAKVATSQGPLSLGDSFAVGPGSDRRSRR